jgi:hypothetical protein
MLTSFCISLHIKSIQNRINFFDCIFEVLVFHLITRACRWQSWRIRGIFLSSSIFYLCTNGTTRSIITYHGRGPVRWLLSKLLQLCSPFWCHNCGVPSDSIQFAESNIFKIRWRFGRLSSTSSNRVNSNRLFSLFHIDPLRHFSFKLWLIRWSSWRLSLFIFILKSLTFLSLLLLFFLFLFKP